MINSKDKGKRFERWCCKWWHQVTGREVQRTAAVAPQLDNAGIDLICTGLLVVQCKAVERSMDIHAVLDRMPLAAGVNVVLHKRKQRGTIVCMQLDDFAWILEKMESHGPRPLPSAN